MDTSETYIKMCDCPEIQVIARVHDFDSHGNYYADNVSFWFCCDCGTFIGSKDDNRIIWLPRQDQLQEMVKWDEYTLLLSHRYFMMAVTYVEEWGEVVKTSHCFNFASMEQLWLAFVMKEKFNKVWNNGWEGV